MRKKLTHADNEFIRCVALTLEHMSKKKRNAQKSPHDLISASTRLLLYKTILEVRYDIGALVNCFKELKLDTCTDVEFTKTFLELVNARHSMKVVLEHPVFRNVLADTSTSMNLTDGADKKT